VDETTSIIAITVIIMMWSHIPTGTQTVSSIFILSTEIEKSLGLSLQNYE